MSKQDFNDVLQRGIEKIKAESSRRWKNLDHSMNLELKLDYNSDEHNYGIVHGLEIAAKLLLNLLKITESKEVT